MDRFIINELFDIYECLLTDHEILVFKDYYQDDLSLSEIAQNNDVSRAAIHKTVQNIEKKLENYESLLHLRKYKNKLLNILGSDNIMVIKNSIREILGK